MVCSGGSPKKNSCRSKPVLTEKPGACKEGSVRINMGLPGSFPIKAGYPIHPEIWHENEWYPICGHYFWDSDDGVTIFCKRLGFHSVGDVSLGLVRDVFCIFC